MIWTPVSDVLRVTFIASNVSDEALVSQSLQDLTEKCGTGK